MGSDHMPELEPQVIVPPKLAVEKPQAMIAKGRMENGHRESQSGSKYEKSGKKKAKEETKQMSIREFLMKKKKVSVPIGDASLSSASSQEDEILVKKQKSEKLKELSDVKGNGVMGKEKQVLGTTEAIEKKFDSNVGYLTAFESFMGDKNDKQSMKGGKEMSLLSKPSPKWNRQSRLQSSPKKSRKLKENQIKSARKSLMKDNSSSSSDDSDSDSNEDSSTEGSESNDNSSLDRQELGRRAAKQASTAISKSLKQVVKASHNTSSDDSGDELKLKKPPDKLNGSSKKLWSK